jgi:hypothetical protein
MTALKKQLFENLFKRCGLQRLKFLALSPTAFKIVERFYLQRLNCFSDVADSATN